MKRRNNKYLSAIRFELTSLPYFKFKPNQIRCVVNHFVFSQANSLIVRINHISDLSVAVREYIINLFLWRITYVLHHLLLIRVNNIAVLWFLPVKRNRLRSFSTSILVGIRCICIWHRVSKIQWTQQNMPALNSMIMNHQHEYNDAIFLSNLSAIDCISNIYSIIQLPLLSLKFVVYVPNHRENLWISDLNFSLFLLSRE